MSDGPVVPTVCIRCQSPITVSGTGVLECEKCKNSTPVEQPVQVFYASRVFLSQLEAMAWIMRNVPKEEARFWFVFVVQGKLAEVAKAEFSDAPEEESEGVVIELKPSAPKKPKR